MQVKRFVQVAFFALLILLGGASILPAPVQAEVELSQGATLYVPIYSNVYSGPKKRAYHLAAMMSFRNTDPTHAVTIQRADYYDERGKKIEGYIDEPVVLGPLASTNIYIKEYDERGGTGANFIVKWSAAIPVNQPIIQGIMLGFKSGQGVSFICPAQIITEHRD